MGRRSGSVDTIAKLNVSGVEATREAGRTGKGFIRAGPIPDGTGVAAGERPHELLADERPAHGVEMGGAGE